MRRTNKLAIVVSLVTLVFICWQAVVAQQIYPSTGQNAFAPSSNAFPVSPPTRLDQQTGADSEMSPDHWGSTAKFGGQNSYLSANTAQPWDGQIESHPWLQQDEMAGFDPSGFPDVKRSAIPVSADPETQAEIPLPPSATGPTGIPLPPSSSLAPAGNAEPRLTPSSTGNSLPPAGASPTFNSEPPLIDGPSIIREPSLNIGPAKNFEEPSAPPVSDSSLRTFKPAGDAGQPADPPPLPKLPSAKAANDLLPRVVNPRTVDYPDGEYRSEIDPPSAVGGANGTFNPRSAPNAAERRSSTTQGNADMYGNTVSTPHENVNGERGGFSEREVRPSVPAGSIGVNDGPQPAAGQPSVTAPHRYPFSNLVGKDAPAQKIETPTPVGATSPAGTPGCGCNNPAAQPNNKPNFRPDLGFRSPDSLNRGFLEDDGQEFGYEEEHYPSMRELLKTGRYFGSVEAILLKPHFQGNTSIAQTDGLTQAYDFDWALAPRLRFGFESQFGPGGELVYSQYDQNSDPTVFVSDGTVSGTSSVFLPGQNAWSVLTASNAGETLVTDQSLEIQQVSACVFKDLKFRRAKLNGIFGFQYVGIHQELSSYLLDSGGNTIGQLSNRSDKHMLGPHVGFEYYRKIGHTGLVMVNNFGGSILAGNSDQYVDNGLVNVSATSGADEFLTILDIGFGIQKHKRFGETRSVYWKIGYDGQSWLGGGNASSPQADFGIRGYTFAIGFNR